MKVRANPKLINYSTTSKIVKKTKSNPNMAKDSSSPLFKKIMLLVKTYMAA